MEWTKERVILLVTVMRVINLLVPVWSYMLANYICYSCADQPPPLDPWLNKIALRAMACTRMKQLQLEWSDEQSSACNLRIC
jgi:hypothetical protein